MFYLSFNLVVTPLKKAGFGTADARRAKVAVRQLAILRNRSDAFISRLVVARTEEDLHDYV